MDLDKEKFIIEIQKRPAIWNNKSYDYSDRINKIKQWEEVVDLFSKSNYLEDKKKKLGQFLQKRWKNMRDTFMKECRRSSTLRSGSSSTTTYKYKYFKHLLFLKPLATYKKSQSLKTESNSEIVDDEYFDRNIKSCKRTSMKNDDDEKHRDVRKLTPVNNKEEDPDRCFMLSLLDDFKRLPCRLKPLVKINLIKCIMEAQDEKYEFNLHREQYFFPAPQIEELSNLENESSSPHSRTRQLKEI